MPLFIIWLISILNTNPSHAYELYDYDSSSSISDYILYLNDYKFNWDKEEDWDKINIINHKHSKHPYQARQACTFAIPSIQKRVCVHNKRDGGFMITSKSAAKSSYDNIELDWDNNDDWSEISHTLSNRDRYHNKHELNTKYINDMIQLKDMNHIMQAAAAHENMLQNYYHYNGFPSEDPFTQEMADTLSSDQDEMYGLGPMMGGGRSQQAMQQMMPQYNQMRQYNRMQYMQQHPQQMGAYGQAHMGGQMSGYSGGYGQMQGQMGGINNLPPSIQQALSQNPALLSMVQQQQANGGAGGADMTKILEALLSKDIQHNQQKAHTNACSKCHKQPTITSQLMQLMHPLEYEMQQNVANQEKQMWDQQKQETQQWIRQSDGEYKNMEKGIMKQGSKINQLLDALHKKKGKGSATKDMVQLVHELKGKGNNDNEKLLAALMAKKRKKKDVGSSYQKQYTDYIKKYQKYYKDWYKTRPGANMGTGYGMMGGMMPGMQQPITHVHIHHSASAHVASDNMLIQKCKPMQSMEICAKYNQKNKRLHLTVRVGSHKKLRRKTAAAHQNPFSIMNNMLNTFDDYDDIYDDNINFNGRRLLDTYYDDLYDDLYDDYDDDAYDDEAIQMSDFGDMFGYSLWKAETMDWTDSATDSLSDNIWNIFDEFDEFTHYLNTIDYAFDNDNSWDIQTKNTKCSAILPALFARVCLHLDKHNKDVRVHFDTASVNEINDMLNYNNENDEQYSAADIEAIHNMLSAQYNMKLDWNKDDHWNEIKTIYNHAQKYYDNNNAIVRSNIDKCHTMFIASVCVNGNLNTMKFGLKVNIANGKSSIKSSKAKETMDNYYEDYYNNLYDNVYERILAQQIKAAAISYDN